MHGKVGGKAPHILNLDCRSVDRNTWSASHSDWINFGENVTCRRHFDRKFDWTQTRHGTNCRDKNACLYRMYNTDCTRNIVSLYRMYNSDCTRKCVTVPTGISWLQNEENGF